MKANRPYIIAEISANHKGSLDNALQLLDDAVWAGADAVKFQTFTPDSITVNATDPYKIPVSSDLWRGMDLWELMDKAKTPRDWFPILFDRARFLGIDVFSTPYDKSALDFLVELGVDTIKISSFDVANTPFLRAVAEKNLTVILSTGMSTYDEVANAVGTLNPFCKNLILLKCTSSYPCASRDLNLLGIQTLKKSFDLEVGFSDHSTSSLGATIAITLGASVFEKHIRLVGDDKGLDSAFSADKFELRDYIKTIREVQVCLGRSELAPVESEKASIWERPSVIALTDIYPGDIFSNKNIGIRRPYIGSSPSKLEEILGKTCLRTHKKGEGIVQDSYSTMF